MQYQTPRNKFVHWIHKLMSGWCGCGVRPGTHVGSGKAREVNKKLFALKRKYQ